MIRFSSNIQEFEESFKSLYPTLCNYAFSFVKDKDTSEDIVQEVFIKVWNNYSKIKTSHSSYLYQAVKNACLDYLKKSYRTAIVSIDEVSDPIDDPLDLHREKTLNEVKNKIALAIDNLPPKCREIFIMRREMQMSYSEISESLGISKKTIENHINLAIKKLRKDLSKKEYLIYLFLLKKLNSQ
ncbi:RNA polymerase sigma-70 factor [Puteibacter caeruleilacunae]|nr:RNA polymerase sigma-70 factor [Puteibacter caeruleilacunae]